jgi:MFS family permease
MKSTAMSREDKKKALILGFGLFGAQLMWMIYNTYMPIFLQAGSPAFGVKAGALGFGLSATVTGFIMTLDNLAAFFIQPLMGPVSDRTRTRIGRRMPFIVALAPLAALAFAVIPVGPLMIPPALNGQIGSLGWQFALTMASAGLMLVAMAAWRTPLFALMPDLFPSRLRSKANAAVNLMSGFGSIIAFVLGGILYSVFKPLPFWFGSVITLAAVWVLFRGIKEPVEATTAAEVQGGVKVLKELRGMPAKNARSLALLLLAIFFYMFGYNSIETFFSSFAVSSLGLKPSQAAYLSAVMAISFMVFAIPSAALAGRFGRKKTIGAGLALFALTLVLLFAFRSAVAAAILLVAAGGAWALININGLPMVLDSSSSEKLMGTYSGLYFIAATLAGTLGPIVNGAIIDLAGRNYSIIFIVCPCFFMAAFLCLLGVRSGEATGSAASAGATEAAR